MTLPPENPPRLRDEPGVPGALLRDGEAEFRRGLDEPRAFRRGARTRSRRALVSWSAAAAVAATVSIWLGARDGKPPTLPVELTVSAETLGFAPAPVTSAVLPAPALSTRAVPEVAPKSRAPSPPSAPAITSEDECRAKVAANQLERAVECFRALARESGVKGEVASYEAARLSVDRLNDAARALPWLDEHRQRHPDGALRGEVDWLRVRALERAGRYQDALSASEALLASPAGRALSADLHLLRARIHADALGNCAEAVSEWVALIGEPTPQGDEAELRRAACLEKLGREADAIDAYTKYLSRRAPRKAPEARERLQALSEQREGP